MNKTEKSCAIFIMPRSSKAWVGSEALWITVAGWSSAAKYKFGKAWVLTSDTIAEPEEVIHYPLVKDKPSPLKKQPLAFLIPTFFKIFIKDIILWQQSRRSKVDIPTPWVDESIAFVWQQHDLFSGRGRTLANKLKVPLVTYVHAPVVWESSKWGVKRYIWGWFLEKFFETKSLKQSDIVACVSSEVATKLISMGIDENKIMISPMAVDQHLFEQSREVKSLYDKLNLQGNFIIGWTGSFRSFHGLDSLIKAFYKVYEHDPDCRLVLVGDGFERESIEKQVQELKLSGAVIFAGRQPFADIPTYISTFDIAVISARSSEGFHYSPLKLPEYMIAGKPVVAPRAGEIPRLFKDGFHLALYTAGDDQELASKLLELKHDPIARAKLGKQGKQYALITNTWDNELAKLLNFI